MPVPEAGTSFFLIYAVLPHLSSFFPPSSGSPAELCQLCVDDEVVAVDGVAVANMNDKQWEDKMTHALQNGSLTMDIRRYGNKGRIMSQKKIFLSPKVICSNLTSNITNIVCVAWF